jgi:hypothetical protein
MAMRTLESLTLSDLKNSPVWEMADDSKSGDILVTQIKSIPVKSLQNRLIGTQVHLADGSAVWCLLGNIEPTNPLSTRHLLTASLHHKRKWFNLARYHDIDFKSRDGAALARFLGKPVSDVFPISYDIRDFAVGVRESLVGTISLQIDERLTAEDLINLALMKS